MVKWIDGQESSNPTKNTGTQRFIVMSSKGWTLKLAEIDFRLVELTNMRFIFILISFWIGI